MKLKKLKSLLCVALALTMVLALTACGSSGSNSTSASDVVDANVTSASDAAETAGLTTINEGKLTISMSADFPPYESLDDSGNIVGIEVDIMNLIAEQLGLELQIDDMDFDSALLAVQQGKSDMVVSGVSITDERKATMNFTDSYTTAVQVIVVPEGSDVTLDNLGDQLIGTQRGTTGFIYTDDDYGTDHVNG
ncbi:MAG: transporter substrate-binding domain-containing protein [Oscillospiraceae bacterium]|nr:transporter substrate-binding domain-containing protein [Oscillospiraceae bacterium]